MAEDAGVPTSTTTNSSVRSGQNIPLPPSRSDYFNNEGEVDQNQSGEEVIVDDNTAALKQKGYLQDKGFFGDQSLSNLTTAFNRAVSVGVGLTPLARSISSTTGRGTRTKVNNYYLYDNEKEFLRKKAIEFSSVGIVPYDVMEEFLYILVSVDRIEDLSYISSVVGIPELNNVNLVREPLPLLSVKDLYKVGYLANGVASINKQYGDTYNAGAALDYGANPYSSLFNAAAAGAAISRFPVTSIAVSLVQDVVSQIGLTTAITSAFSAFSSMTGIAKIAAIGQLTSVASQLTNLNSLIQSTISSITKFGIAALSSVVNSFYSLLRTVRDLTNFTSQLAGITSLAATPGKILDVASQMIKISSIASSIASVASGILSAVKAIAGPGAIGAAAGVILNKVGGYARSGILIEQSMGQRLPPSVLYRNPTMMSPSYAGKAFFGENLAPQAAVDQVFSRVIAAFPEAVNGSGNMSFGMQNFASFAGATTIASLASRVLLGTPTVPTSGVLAGVVATTTQNICNILNVATNSTYEARRSDNAIPIIAAVACAVVNETRTPFPSSTYSNGWKLASATGNYVQREQSAFFQTARTSL